MARLVKCIKLGIEAEDADWMAGVLSEIGEAKGAKLFKDIVAALFVNQYAGTVLTAVVCSITIASYIVVELVMIDSIVTTSI